MPIPGLRETLKLTARFAVAGFLVLWLAHRYERVILEAIVQPIREFIALVQNDFDVFSVTLSEEPNSGIELRADFASPTYVSGRTLYPLNLDPKAAGWMQINLTAGAVLQYAALGLITLLAWPMATLRDCLIRLTLAAPILALLLLVPVCITALAELWFPIHDEYARAEIWPLLVCSRFLMGGGGIALALCASAIVIVLAKTPKYGEPDAADLRYA